METIFKGIYNRTKHRNLRRKNFQHVCTHVVCGGTGATSDLARTEHQNVKITPRCRNQKVSTPPSSWSQCLSYLFLSPLSIYYSHHPFWFSYEKHYVPVLCIYLWCNFSHNRSFYHLYLWYLVQKMCMTF